MSTTREPSCQPTWQFAPFARLSGEEVYALLALRQQVFVVEQTCPFLDADGRDHEALHLLGWIERGPTRMLCAYARISLPTQPGAPASIGRVVTERSLRRMGLGRALMIEAISRIEALSPSASITIGAQLYLERFYQSLAFRRTSPPYDEDGIPHITMLRPPFTP